MASSVQSLHDLNIAVLYNDTHDYVAVETI
jgi:hypothetical protein